MKAQTQRSLRDLHNWFGVLFAPGILFFSFTGILQTLGLHENDAHPPAWIATIASLHKHQVVGHGRRHAPPPGASPAKAGAAHDDDHDGRPTASKPGVARGDHDHDAPLSPLKIYVLLLSATLLTSTLAGIVIALTNRAARRRTWGLLAVGTLAPLLLILL